MATITIAKQEYETLKRQAKAYRALSARLFELVVNDPVEEVIKDFAETHLYTQGFLKSLEQGLRQSSYAERYAHQATQRQPRKVSRRA